MFSVKRSITTLSLAVLTLSGANALYANQKTELEPIMEKKGFLIAIEGIDGSGKTTLSTKLAQALEQQGITTLVTKEPGGSKLGKEIREIVHTQKDLVCDKAEFLLFAADRAQHFHEEVMPALEQGTVVISDRLSDSSLAYQGFGRGLDCQIIATINTWAMNERKPDLVLYVKIDIETAIKRITQRNLKLTSFEQEKREFWEKVSNGFDQLFADRTEVVVIDGSLAPDDVCQQAVHQTLAKLNMSSAYSKKT
ncbi:MAG: dTMP kinase [Epsilonproteobacteria bacterium]|nr:dTMP kinase [Campylobacterota bacterium]